MADEYVEMDFGTGCVKMTPAHDPNDFEVGLRHNLETIRVLDDNGVVNENGGKYQGMDRYEARKAVVADMEALGLTTRRASSARGSMRTNHWAEMRGSTSLWQR